MSLLKVLEALMIHDKKFTETNLASLIIEPEFQFEDCAFLGINFANYKLKAVSFTNCIFTNCNLANQDLTSATIRDVQFESCNLMGINWCNLNRLEAPNFNKCKLNFSSFQGHKLKKMKVLDCSAIDVDFSETDLTDSQFSNTNLGGTNFNRATLINSDFRSAKDYLFDLRTTKIKGMKLSMPEAINLITVLGAEVDF